MRVAVVFLCVVVAFVSAETCQSDHNCQHLSCSDKSFEVVCEQNMCTCAQKAVHCEHVRCDYKADCSSCQCHHHGHDHHCVDSVCRCTTGTIIG